MPENQIRPTNPFIEFKKEDIEQTIPSRFEKMVEKFSDRLALKTKRKEFTYTELNRAANHIANEILSVGAESREPVALLAEKNGDLIAAILGTLKAGKIYVPLDPTFPRDRLRHIVDNSHSKLILTDSKNEPLGRALTSEKNRLALFNIDKQGMDSSCANVSLSISPAGSIARFCEAECDLSATSPSV